MTAVPFPTKVDRHYVETLPDHPIYQKWGIDGSVRLADDLSAHVQIKYTLAAPDEVLALCTRHELGHVGFFEDMALNDPTLAIEDCQQVDVWMSEVDAWARALDGLISFESGTFVLDCLYTYAVHHANEEEWLAAKRLVADCCTEPERLMEYEPLEPPSGPPPSDIEYGGPPVQVDDGSEPTESEQATESGDPGETDSFPSGERWKALTGKDAIAAAQRGPEHLQEWMRAQGMDDSLKDLPPVIEVLVIG